MGNINKFLKRVNFKSIYFNFKYLPFKTAMKLPILLANNVRLKQCKGRVIINSPIKTGLIQIGFGNVGIFDSKLSKSIWEVDGDVVFNGKANIGHGSKICVGNNAQLILGANFNITAESTLVAFKKIEFGNNCLLSWDILVMDTDFHSIYELSSDKKINPDSDIIIGDNVWIGCRCTVLKGSKIDAANVIAANSHIFGQVGGSNQVIGGNPLKALKNNIRWNI